MSGPKGGSSGGATQKGPQSGSPTAVANTGNAPVYMTDPVTGQPIQATPEQAAALAGMGGITTTKALTPEQYGANVRGKENVDWMEANTSAPERFAAGVGSGLTLGLGPALLAQWGMVDPGHVSALETSGLYTAGDVAGTLLPAVLSGGEGAALRMTPAGLMGAAGGSAERFVAGMLPEMGVMGKLGKGAVSMAARGSTEGAIVNMAHTFSEGVIQDHPLTASAILASGMDGALMGGLIGGTLGGATSALGSAADALAARAGGGAEGFSRGASVAARRLGNTPEELAALQNKEGGILRYAKDTHDLLAGKGADFSSKTDVIQRVAKETSADHAAVLSDLESQLTKEAGMYTPSAGRVTERVRQDVLSRYAGNTLRADAESAIQRFESDLLGKADIPVEPVAPKPFTPRAVKSLTDTQTISANEAGNKAFQEATAKYEADMGKFKQELTAFQERGPDGWKGWFDSRADIANRAKAGGIKGDIYRSILGVMDSEMRASMDAAGASLGKEFTAPWASATAGRAFADELAGTVSKKLGQEMAQANPLTVQAPDLGTVAWGTLMGHPIGAMGLVAGKKLIGFAGRNVEPYVAESMYKAAIGAKAEASRVAVQHRISKGVRKFLGLTPRAATVAVAEIPKAPKVKYDTKSLQKELEAAQELTSAQHRQRVIELQQSLTELGQAQLANEMYKQYDAASAYAMYNMPQNKKMKALGSLGKLPVDDALDHKEMKFMRIMGAIKHPLGVIDHLEDGSLSNEEVKALKYIQPALHQEITNIATQEIFEMKMEGKFLPADKIAILGTALDEPIDSTLEKDFVDAIQQAHVALSAPPPEQNSGPPPTPTDTTAFQTPMQRAVG